MGHSYPIRVETITYRIQIGVNAPDEYAWNREGLVYAAAKGLNGFEGTFVCQDNCSL